MTARLHAAHVAPVRKPPTHVAETPKQINIRIASVPVHVFPLATAHALPTHVPASTRAARLKSPHAAVAHAAVHIQRAPVSVRVRPSGAVHALHRPVPASASAALRHHVRPGAVVHPPHVAVRRHTVDPVHVDPLPQLALVVQAGRYIGVVRASAARAARRPRVHSIVQSMHRRQSTKIRVRVIHVAERRQARTTRARRWR